MKKTLIAILVLAVVILVARPFFCNSDDKSAEKDEKQKPLSIAENTDAFNQSFTRLLNTYNDLKNALVASDTGKASAAALTLKTATDSLKVNDIKGDTSGVIKQTALTYTSTITGLAQALAAEKDIKSKRKDFKEIADNIHTLIQTVRYKGQKIYWEYCPMAFDKDGAYWLSYEREIKNPYFGNEMLNCGSVEDSLDYSKK